MKHFTKLTILLLFLYISPLSGDTPKNNRLAVNFTHNPDLKSWVISANESSTDFPLQNLPFGVFKRSNTNECYRIGVAIGDSILDIKKCINHRLLEELSVEVKKALKSHSLNAFMELNWHEWQKVREAIFKLLEQNSPLALDKPLQEKVLISSKNATLSLPVQIGNYTDFYASIEHAKRVGALFRPENPLMPNYKHMPIAYHGRASSIVISGTDVIRPKGMIIRAGSVSPELALTEKLDYEVELGMFVGKGNEQGYPIPIENAVEYIFGFVLVNDWSARDIQSWEYQPLGPFNGKNFATTISPWVVTLDALIPFCSQHNARQLEDPHLADYLQPIEDLALNITIVTSLLSDKMRHQKMQPQQISQVNVKELYWTFPQMIVQHTISGCNLKPGDLIASGTISGISIETYGCLLEHTNPNFSKIILDDQTSRTFLSDEDEVIMEGYSQYSDSVKIGFGKCLGKIKLK